METLRNRLEEKEALLRRLLAEAGRMAELLDQDALDELARCLDIREGYIRRLDELEGLLRADRAYPAWLAGEEGKRYASAMTGLLQAIQRTDVANSDKLLDLRSDAMRQIREANAEKNLEAYTRQAAATSRFINRQG